MNAKEKFTKQPWIDGDDAPELTADVAARAQIAIGGKVIRAASGTLTRRGRPTHGALPKKQVTLRLAPDVIDYFKAAGPGWQTRIGDVLRRHAEEQARRR